ncbi:hypothetical protein EVAR_29960_1 [Eumeta japonica]|uniref:Uncharacterized protein n=1 Tax=Eumeta variegata TaxID=151549 RepID=A0A4C1VGR3_EUMVA|nr:hypothetical protein EVAR_29960_1 [Eumeta japonica]
MLFISSKCTDPVAIRLSASLVLFHSDKPIAVTNTRYGGQNWKRDRGGARRRRRRRQPTASRLKGPRKQKSFAYKLLKRGLAKSFAYKLLKRGLANLMSPTSTSGVAPPLSSIIGKV